MLSYTASLEEMEGNNKKQIYSGFYDYTKSQFMRTRFSIEKIVNLASKSGKRVLLFTIPVYADFLRFRSDSSLPPLHVDLEEMSEEIGFEYFDLLPLMCEVENDW